MREPHRKLLDDRAGGDGLCASHCTHPREPNTSIFRETAALPAGRSRAPAEERRSGRFGNVAFGSLSIFLTAIFLLSARSPVWL
jgi:hypothetical protein